MLKIPNHIAYSALLAIFVFCLAAVPQYGGVAEAKEVDNESNTKPSVTLLEEFNRLLDLLKDRKNFVSNKATLEELDHSDRSEDFFLRLKEGALHKVYGDDSTDIQIETDGGVRQIVVTTTCNDEDGTVLMLENDTCVEDVWVTTSETASGVQTFTVPVEYVTRAEEDTINLKVYACRWDGCEFETYFELPYKKEITFAEQVSIYDRYEWNYEWNDKVYHVQEVMVHFPYKDIRKVYVRVRCDVSGLYIETVEDDRVTCNGRRKYSNVAYRDYETDEQGNVNNLRIESVTTEKVVENSGAVELEFRFVDNLNRSHFVYHRPVQEVVIIDEEEEGDEE